MVTIAQAFAIALRQHQAGDLQGAEQVCRQILQLQPEHCDALQLLGVVAHQTGRSELAIGCLSEALKLQPDSAAAHSNLGTVLLDLSRPQEAVKHFEQALLLQPGFAQVHNNLGNALYALGRHDAAVESFERALHLRPELAEVHNNLGNALRALGRLPEAAERFAQALKLRPDYAEAHNNLGNVLHRLDRLPEAVEHFQEAIRLQPDLAEARNNLGNAYKEQGDLDPALACYRRAAELKSDFWTAASNVLNTLHFHPDHDARAILAEHLRWASRYAEPLAQAILPHPNDRTPDRRLRIGYVSPDFRSHPVGRFILPLLSNHDHARYEIHCYNSSAEPDMITAHCRTHSDVWREIAGLSDEQAAHVIRQDGIDILVDLTMHMGSSRILVFARKPAPVQVTYLAYCGTTGLATMDCRLTDPYLDPPEQDEWPYSERSLHLPGSYWCYQPVVQTPAAVAPPVLQAGHVTFGCLNNFCKVTNPTLETWSRLLLALPESRLVLHAREGSHRDRVREFLARRGVEPGRLTFLAHVPMAEYLRIYDRIDVALDPFPYGGGTTTCDALWMGVPVVSLAGKTAVGRGGLSILSNVGLPELVARDCDQYVQLCLELANDRPRLKELRATLRERMERSPLMDAPRFARGVEAAFRTIWQRWCDGGLTDPQVDR